MIGCPLTRFISISLKRHEIRAQDVICGFTKLSSDWLGSKDAARAFVGVVEHPPNRRPGVHLLVHVPEPLMDAFNEKEIGWLSKLGMEVPPDEPKNEQTIVAKPIGTKAGRLEGMGNYMRNFETTLGYMLKGAEPAACDALAIDHTFQGSVSGKRIAIAQAIGSKARRDANYERMIAEKPPYMFPRRNRLDALIA